MNFRLIPRQKSSCLPGDLLEVWKLLVKGECLNGQYIEEFEAEFAQHHSMKYALATNSCRTAFYLIIKALGIKVDEEVILPAFNMSAFPKILKLKKIKPVFVDVDEGALNIDVKKIENSITKNTRAIVAVHLLGNPCDMEPIMDIAKKHGLFIIEDCANSIGAKYKGRLVGTFGDAACFSFGHAKDVPTFGGGMVLTNNEVLYKRLKLLNNEFVPMSKGEVLKIIARNIVIMLATSRVLFPLLTYPLVLLTRLIGNDILGDIFEEKDEMITSINKRRYMNFQARIGINRLKEFTELQNKRVDNSNIYNSLLAGISGVKITEAYPDGNHVYWRYPVWVECRQEIMKSLIKHGVDCGKIYTYDCNNYRIFKEFKTNCPLSERASAKILVLPNGNYLKKEDMNFISKLFGNSIRSVFERNKENK